MVRPTKDGAEYEAVARIEANGTIQFEQSASAVEVIAVQQFRNEELETEDDLERARR